MRQKRLSKKVIAKFKIINECLKRGMPEKEIVEILAKQFNQIERCQYLVIRKYHAEPDLVSSSLVALSKGEPFFYNREDSCYFCNGEKQLIDHHLSYNPQKLIKICLPCHNKLHFLIDEYHKNIKEKEETIWKLNQRLDIIQNAFGTIKEEVEPNFLPKKKSENDYEKY